MARTDHIAVQDDRWNEVKVTEPAIAAAGALSAVEAAQFLHVSCATLRAWETEFGFPTTLMTSESACRYPVAQLLALRGALSTSASVASAVQTVRHRFALTS